MNIKKQQKSYDLDIYRYRILILDFGSQYVRLIAKIIRELGVYCEIWNYNVSELQIRQFHPNGIVLSGSPESIINVSSPRVTDYVFCSGIPVLGICYGMQIMVVQLGGEVHTNDLQREFGYTQVNVLVDNFLVRDIYDFVSKKGVPILNVWMSHNDTVISVPQDFIIVADTNNCPVAIIANEQRNLYGLQFHPEVTHTKQGRRILERFVIDICHCRSLLDSNIIIEKIIFNIRKLVKNDRVILGLSGGVDSSVAALLLHRAIGKNLICLFIDNGLLRFNEDYKNVKAFCEDYNMNIIYLAKEERFFGSLIGIYDPEEKRKIIGKIFMEIFEEQMQSLANITWLAQGTICSDVVESAALDHSYVRIIKSHHNVAGLPGNRKFRLIEPIRNFFKDEVRKMGFSMGLPVNILYRHPFPGPGLAIRVIGEVKKEYCILLRKADLIFIEELRKSNLYLKISQAFVVFLSVRSVGIVGDNRKYGWVVALRAVNSVDFMTAKYTVLSNVFLTKVANRIINEISDISRVVYDISSKPPATIEWE
ncbi:glutamine-hydrolyzing GMP synthase [Blochmannia endosymbiont of Camponotus (Colobopsis) obliquus]|uniref:glutamine-hydrolyzing GMP synthase n=1 Tax=Blochmannia endosymbiont of Camponotus (Colobopsis) obliquus TaxID=1505597 RepID=UPI00061A8828|nr:glutamine-hydrolyzing GMP synthase [Blochmannia endosymbiont of Camponotus (Colobopsis) obliquus]AKC60673.1 GMP synthase [glutamine-hydrolyzing] [Blochmannia endosymbiont of Camponotus (Colobopsis) obliquus]